MTELSLAEAYRRNPSKSKSPNLYHDQLDKKIRKIHTNAIKIEIASTMTGTRLINDNNSSEGSHSDMTHEGKMALTCESTRLVSQILGLYKKRCCQPFR